MKAIISDVHGNYEALKSVFEDLDSLPINEIYFLGDVCGYYSQINECCDLLRERRVNSILGNHDWYMISDSDCPRSKSANDCLKYQRAVITQENKDWLTSLPILMKYGALSMVHGGWRNPLDEYLNPDEAYFSSYPQEFFASGHTHKQLTRNYGSKVYCNPGSVGQPRDNDNRAAYALFDGCEFELRRVEYDIQKVCDLMSKAGFNEYYYKRLKYGSEHFIN